MTVDEVRALLGEKVNDNPPIYRYSKFGREIVQTLMDYIDALRHDLDLQRGILESDADTMRKQRQEVLDAQAEVVRLKGVEQRVKEGRLTEEEFQALCHNLSPDDEVRFKLGCYETWKRLFGTNTSCTVPAGREEM